MQERARNFELHWNSEAVSSNRASRQRCKTSISMRAWLSALLNTLWTCACLCTVQSSLPDGRPAYQTPSACQRRYMKVLFHPGAQSSCLLLALSLQQCRIPLNLYLTLLPPSLSRSLSLTPWAPCFSRRSCFLSSAWPAPGGVPSFHSIPSNDVSAEGTFRSLCSLKSYQANLAALIFKEHYCFNSLAGF